MNVHGILAKHCLHCILCNSSMSRAIFCAFVLPRIARMQLISRVDIALPQILDLGMTCRRRTLASTPPHTKLTANECDICRRFCAAGGNRGRAFEKELDSHVCCASSCSIATIAFYTLAHRILPSPPYISQPANPRMQYHFNMNMPHCSPLGVRWQPGRPQRPVRRPLRGAA